jgi:hypothetical protein
MKPNNNNGQISKTGLPPVFGHEALDGMLQEL